MQLFSNLTIFLMLSIITSVPSMVSADQMVRYIFNNGIEPTTPPCTSAENALIDAIFVNRRRQLSSTTMSNETIARGLATLPSQMQVQLPWYQKLSCNGLFGIRRDHIQKSKTQRL
jgi:hypothetical protein